MDRRRFLGRTAALAGIGLASGARAEGGRPPRRRGVNLAGAEFGTRPDFCNENPGEAGRDYTYNSERTVAYFAGHGFTLFRVPFRWERIQPRPGQDLDESELGRLKAVVGWVKRRGGTVVLDVHNYGRYRLKYDGQPVDAVIDGRVGDERPVTARHFADLWHRLSAAFRDDPAVEAYGLMNEPHDMGSSDWKAISRAAVAAIRAGGDRKLVLVAGDHYANCDPFDSYNGPRAWIDDPAGRVAYEAHCYFDADFSGRYAMSYDAELARDKDLEHRGARRLAGFVTWCARNRVRGFLGEFGAPGDDPRWLKVLARFLRALDDAGMDGCYWAAGEWWSPEDRTSLQPRDDFRRPAPQMDVLLRRDAG